MILFSSLESLKCQYYKIGWTCHILASLVNVFLLFVIIVHLYWGVTLVLLHQDIKGQSLSCKSQSSPSHTAPSAQDNPPKQDNVHRCDRKIFSALHNHAGHEMWSNSRKHKVSSLQGWVSFLFLDFLCASCGPVCTVRRGSAQTAKINTAT